MKELQFSILKGKALHVQRVELNDKEYSELSNARAVLKRIFSHEELYDQVIESYVDAKSAMYEMSIRTVANGITLMDDYIGTHNQRSKLNRLYFNTLNLSKLYLDRYFHEKKKKSFVKSVTGSEELHEAVRQHRQSIWNDNPSYVLGCCLRNYVQHSSLPVKAMTTGFRAKEQASKASAVFHIHLNRQALIDSDISPSKLSTFGDKIDLHEVMDGYVLAISEMHMKSRQLTKDSVEKSIGVLTTKLQQIELEYRDRGLQFGINVVDTANEERFPLNLDWFDIVKHLQDKNSRAVNFQRYTHAPYQKA
ncbi:hypothetical protein [Vibrio furnissii]|uniref:hypothetical protein n=1 Tax=Vibrio furnissii TaxID=29494 RepID=UPI0012AE1327|nr:hypothetical protein [Vibrio furnissii]